jgi:hypothetical protein
LILDKIHTKKYWIENEKTIVHTPVTIFLFHKEKFSM